MKDKKEKKIRLGKIGILPDGNRIFVANDESKAPYVMKTNEDAWLDENNVVHKGNPNG